MTASESLNATQSSTTERERPSAQPLLRGGRSQRGFSRGASDLRSRHYRMTSNRIRRNNINAKRADGVLTFQMHNHWDHFYILALGPGEMIVVIPKTRRVSVKPSWRVTCSVSLRVPCCYRKCAGSFRLTGGSRADVSALQENGPERSGSGSVALRRLLRRREAPDCHGPGPEMASFPGLCQAVGPAEENGELDGSLQQMLKAIADERSRLNLRQENSGLGELGDPPDPTGVPMQPQRPVRLLQTLCFQILRSAAIQPLVAVRKSALSR